MSKTMCKTAKKRVIDRPKYVCKKCGENAEKEKHLCKPSRIKKK